MTLIPIHHERTNGHLTHISPTVLRLDESFGCRVHRHKHIVRLPRRAQYVRGVDTVSPELLLGTLAFIACIAAAALFGVAQVAQFVLSHWSHS